MSSLMLLLILIASELFKYFPSQSKILKQFQDGIKVINTKVIVDQQMNNEHKFIIIKYKTLKPVYLIFII